jgi:hypothetical protein
VSSLNVSINDSGIFLSEPDEPAASNMRKRCAPSGVCQSEICQCVRYPVSRRIKSHQDNDCDHKCCAIMWALSMYHAKDALVKHLVLANGLPKSRHLSGVGYELFGSDNK